MISKTPLIPLLAIGSLGFLAACSSSNDTDSGNDGEGGEGGSGQGSAGASGETTGGVGGEVGNPGGSGGSDTNAGGSGGTNEAGAGGTNEAGAGGNLGIGGEGGAGGSGGETLDLEGDDRAGPSAGCLLQTDDPVVQDVRHDTTVNGVERRYWTRLPDGYDGTTAYPLAFYGLGCGGNGMVEGAPLDGAIAGKAIRVFLMYTSDCFDTGTDPSPEIPYFEQVLAEVEANYCTEKSKVFVSGYSSGGWLTNLLSCSSGDKIRAIGTAAGGLVETHGPCKGKVAAIMHVGVNDTTNGIENINDNGVDEGSGVARNRLLEMNGCTDQTAQWDPRWPFCEIYQGCDEGYPVVWCPENVGHTNGGQVSSQGWWELWSSLP